jgi:hypothetical protein
MDINADHEAARRSPDHVIDALGDIFASVETATDESPYIRLYLAPYSNTIDGRWIAVDLHDSDAAQIIAELGKALSDVLFNRDIADGKIHELTMTEKTPQNGSQTSIRPL